MTNHTSDCPRHYTAAVRALLRFALVLLVVGLLSGVAFQESAKKVSLTPAVDGLAHWDVTMHLALVHGHIIVTGVLLPVAMAGILHMARSHGGRDVSPRALAWSLFAYLPCVTITVILMLYKGYYFLLSARAGESSLAVINETLFGGVKALRHGLYGLSHAGMGLGLCIFVWSVWRSLKTGRG